MQLRGYLVAALPGLKTLKIGLSSSSSSLSLALEGWSSLESLSSVSLMFDGPGGELGAQLPALQLHSLVSLSHLLLGSRSDGAGLADGLLGAAAGCPVLKYLSIDCLGATVPGLQALAAGACTELRRLTLTAADSSRAAMRTSC